MTKHQLRAGLFTRSERLCWAGGAARSVRCGGVRKWLGAGGGEAPHLRAEGARLAAVAACGTCDGGLQLDVRIHTIRAAMAFHFCDSEAGGALEVSCASDASIGVLDASGLQLTEVVVRTDLALGLGRHLCLCVKHIVDLKVLLRLTGDLRRNIGRRAKLPRTCQGKHGKEAADSGGLHCWRAIRDQMSCESVLK